MLSVGQMNWRIKSNKIRLCTILKKTKLKQQQIRSDRHQQKKMFPKQKIDAVTERMRQTTKGNKLKTSNHRPATGNKSVK